MTLITPLQAVIDTNAQMECTINRGLIGNKCPPNMNQRKPYIRHLWSKMTLITPLQAVIDTNAQMECTINRGLIGNKCPPNMIST